MQSSLNDQTGDMQMIKITARVALATILVTAGAAVAAAQVPGHRPIVGTSTMKARTETAAVVAVDPSARTVTLASSNGTSVMRKVSDSVQNLNQVRVGNTVVVTFQDQRSFVLSQPNEKAPPSRDITSALPKSRSGAEETEDVFTYYVVSTDPTANTITLVNPSSGPDRTFKVTDPLAQQELSRVKKGDKMTTIDKLDLVVGIDI
jgi:hypothetical protein